jgi:hypothetical protein
LDRTKKFRDCVGIVDSSSFEIQKPSINESLFYSVKHKAHVLKYEVVCSLLDPEILFYSGPYPGSYHDLTIARNSILLELGPRELLLGDLGYVGERAIVTPIKNCIFDEQFQINMQIHSLRHSIERVFARIKNWKSMQIVWRHEMEFHFYCFSVVINLVNFELKTNHPLNQ